MEILTDKLHRLAYATDASAYREVPIGVAYPRNEADIVELIAEAQRRNTYLIPRAGGTSIAGQVVGNGIVVDISRYWNKIIGINVSESYAWVEPGVVRDELNIALKPYGLFFSPETSTSNRCCIGGMVGNNSCGTHSLIYGSTRHHVLQLRGILSDGSRFDTAVRGSGALEQKIYAQLEQWQQDVEARHLIEKNFPEKTLKRRSCGYAIDEAIEGKDLDLCKLLCGSEGTLAFITAIKVSLDPLPSPQQMVLCAHCDSMEQSYQANLIALKHSPTAVELMDGKILDLCKNNPTQLKNRFFVEGNPAALIIAEFNGEQMEQQAKDCEQELKNLGLAYHCSRVYGTDIAKVWALRKAGLGVLTGVIGDEKPIGVIEDTAVSPNKLPLYLKDFSEMLKGLDLDCVYYGHIGTGELHLRPIINIKTAEGRKKFRSVAEATALLVKKHNGCLSGEHGDGRLRGEFIPLMYSEKVYEMMCEVKRCWDPYGVFNRGKIVEAPPMDECLRYEVGQRYFCKDTDLMGRIEQCNGAGDCIKSNKIGGTLCPAFKVSNDELNSTRARANILRETLTRGGQKGHLSNEERKLIEEVLYSCLACKGCKAECPSNVDMTRIRSEVLQMLYDREGTPLRSWMVARMAMVEKLGSLVAPLYNFFASWHFSSSIIKKVVSFAPERSLPKVYHTKFHVRKEVREKKVCLFLDEFTRYNEPQLAETMIKLLENIGYQVIIPKQVESGRATISKGCLHLASKYARKNVHMLKDIVDESCPLVGIEPSCILSFRDEYPRLVSKDMKADAEQLANNCLLYDEFFMREVARGNITSDQFKEDKVEIWLHGHCHQKALIGIEKTAAMLRLLKGVDLHIIPSGCCGMAGSFGYEKEHYKTSLAIGEMILFPTIRKATQQDNTAIPIIVVAPGTSCRQQILDGTGVHAIHPIEVLWKFLAR